MPGSPVPISSWHLGRAYSPLSERISLFQFPSDALQERKFNIACLFHSVIGPGSCTQATHADEESDVNPPEALSGQVARVERDRRWSCAHPALRRSARAEIAADDCCTSESGTYKHLRS